MPRGLTARILAAGGILLLLIGASFAGLFVAIVELRAADAHVSRSADELRAASRIERLLVDMETGLRGFVLTREERFLEPWREGREAFPREVGDLAGRVDTVTQATRMRTIATAGTAYIEDYGVRLIEAVRRGDPSASSVDTTEQGRLRVDALRSLLADFIETERENYIARQESANALAATATLGATVAIGGSVALIGLFIAYLARTLVRPVTHAAGMAGRLAAGELSTRMPETGTAEIGALERSFNSLAASLEQSHVAQQRLLDEQSALRRVATLVAEASTPDVVFAAVTREVAALLPADSTVLARYEPDGTRSRIAGWWTRDGGPATFEDGTALTGDSVLASVRETGTAARLEATDAAKGPVAERLREGGFRALLACPIVVEGRPWGAMVAATTQEDGLPADAEDRMMAFTELVGTAIANAQARSELAASRARIVTASDETRRRIERNLHDGAQQRLVSIGLRLRSLESEVPLELEKVLKGIRYVAAETTGVIDELREISRGLYPASLSRAGVTSAVRGLARRSPIPIQLDIRTDAPLSDAVQAAGYYVVAEAVTNAAKHAAARTVWITLEDRDEMLRVSVRDDGIGGADPDRGSGLTGLRDRVEALGGRMEVASPPGEGTLLVADLPIR